jgi:hypothetical protein
MAMLAFRDGVPAHRAGHYAHDGVLMTIWKALEAAMDAVEFSAGTVLAVQTTAENFGPRRRLRDGGALVERREKALQVALAASVEPPGPMFCSLRWSEDVAYWVSSVTRHLRFPIRRGLVGLGRNPR